MFAGFVITESFVELSDSTSPQSKFSVRWELFILSFNTKVRLVDDRTLCERICRLS